MRIFVFLSIFLVNFICFPIDAIEKNLPLPKMQSEEEVLFLRRIVQFWEEGKVEIVKKQIKKHLDENPKSSLLSYLNALLGDVNFQEERYYDAIYCYHQITNYPTKRRVYLNLLQSLFEVNLYKELTSEALFYLENHRKIDDSEKSNIYYFIAQGYYQQSLDQDNDGAKEDLLVRAKPYFHKLIGSKYETQSLEILCNIHHILKEYKKASEIYIHLAEKDDKNRETYLVQAAKMQTQFDKNLAINTFDKIIDEENEKSKDAAYYKLALLYEEKKYEEIISSQKELASLLPDINFANHHYIVGKSYYFLEKFELAKEQLKNYVEKEQNKNSSFCNNALISLMQIAEKLNDPFLYEESYNNFASTFPSDNKLPYVLLAKAVIFKKNDMIKKAKKDFLSLLEKYPKYKNDENVIFEYSKLLYDTNSWDESRQSFYQFVKRFNQSDLNKSAWKYFINSSINATNIDNNNFNKQRLLADLNKFMKLKNLSEEESLDCDFISGQTYYELEQYQKAGSFLLNFIKKVPQKSPSYAEAHMLAALCFNKINDPRQFCFHAQKALESNPKLLEKQHLCLNLFNAYITLTKNKDEKTQSLYDNAANYLYLALQSKTDKTSISQNNIIWLGDFYYHKVMDKLQGNSSEIQKNREMLAQNAKKAIDIFKVIVTPKIIAKLDKDPNRKTVENQLVKLQRLLAIYEPKEQLAFLEKIYNKYSNCPEVKWYFKEELFYELALAYMRKNDDSKAMLLLSHISQISKKGSYFSSASILYSSRILLKEINKQNDQSHKKVVESLLLTLKNLSLRKDLDNEPLHLEAAMEYIDLQCSITDKHVVNKRIDLLTKFIQNFSSNNDMTSKMYQTKRKTSKNKDKLLNRYLSTAEAERAVYKYLRAKKREPSSAKKYKKEALDMISILEKQKNMCSSYLRKRIDKLTRTIQRER
jgi:hypothetical protein